MNFAERMKSITERVASVQDTCETEEATKTALVLPFLQALGYDVFNPNQVIPEFTADVGIKRGEKIDYAVVVGGKPILLFECKRVGSDLRHASSQLYRYFNTTSARVAVLTDGVQYRFFADLCEPNKLDPEPFLDIDLEQLDDRAVGELQRLTLDAFDLEEVLAAADALRIRGQIQRRLAKEFADPSDEFVRVVAAPVHEGRLMQAAVDRYRDVVRSSLARILKDQVDARLKAALAQNDGEMPGSGAGENVDVIPQDSAAEDGDNEDGQSEDAIVTTIDELAGYYAVKAILRDDVDPNRVAARDTKSYFGILLDDNNRKPICRLWFNRKRKYLGVFDSNKQEERIEIACPDDLFRNADRIRESLGHAMSR